MSEIAKLPSWVRTEYHQKDTCAIWVVTVKDRHDKWHVFYLGAVGGPGSAVAAEVRANAFAQAIAEEVRQVFKTERDIKTSTRSRGDVCWWNNAHTNHHRLTARGIELLFESNMKSSEFYDHAYAALQLDENAPTD